MNKPIIEIKNLSKVYSIGHEQKSAPGTLTFRDSFVQTLRRPMEFFTGHKLEKEKFWALKELNFEVGQGEVIGIIGRNGSGKSTLLKILSRIVEPTGGEIIMRGRVASLLEVGTGFHPELTGRENIFFNGAILGMSQKEIRSKFDEIVAFSEVEKFLDTPVKFYSSGMYVRLAFAVAAHLDPDILIVDEVLAVGDAAFQKKCLGKMRDVAGQGRTVIFVSHSMNTVQQLCDKCIVMAKGEILKVARTDEAIAFYEQGDSLNEATKKIPADNTKTLTVAHIDLLRGKTPTNLFKLGDAVTVALTVSATKPLKAARVALGIATSAGLPVRTVWSSSKELTAGKYRYELELDDVILAAGNYSITLGTSVNGYSDQDLDDIIDFSVMASNSEEHSRILDQGAGTGVVKNQLEFTVTPEAKGK